MPRSSARPFNKLSAFEADSCADKGDDVGCVHGPPPLLRGLDRLEDHGQGGGAGAGASGDLGPQAARMPGHHRACDLARSFADLLRHQRRYLLLEWIRQAEQDAPKP